MSAIDSIIAAATPGPWMIELASWNSHREEGTPIVRQADYGAIVCSCVKSQDDNATFIVTFDPEHVALMEAVIEAGDAPISGQEAREALDAYRKARG